MEAVQKTIEDLASVFKTSMAEFHKDLQNATAAPASASPTSRLTSEFENFRSFILSSLANLQSQVEILVKLHDQEEMRKRRKMLLVHGVTEIEKEDTLSVLVRVVTNNLKITNIDPLNISRCHRMGQVRGNAPRPILVKFRDVRMRDNIWFEKTRLKDSGITISEFLNKGRHEVFMAARKSFGVSKCWTRNGIIFISAPDGSRHHITSLAELKAIPLPSTASDTSSGHTVAAPELGRVPLKDNKRPKRILKGR